MSPFETRDLLALDAFGLIPGPDESEGEFCLRVARIQATHYYSNAKLPQLDSVFERVRATFGIFPRWARIDFCQHDLRWWQVGGWDGGDAPRIALQSALYRGEYWGYSCSEVLAHELAHAARCAFPHDTFDEFLCYQLSKSWLRRKFGPYFSQKWTPSLLCLAVASSAVMPLCTELDSHFFAAQTAVAAWCVIQCALMAKFLQVALYCSLFARARRLLFKALGEGDGRWWLFRLTQQDALSIGFWGVRWRVLLRGKGPRRRLLRAARAQHRL